jgi:hypothetical protein
MSEVNTRRCDAPKCDAIKGEANKWWTVLSNVHAAVVTTCDRAEYTRALLGSGDLNWKYEDACGEECLQKILGEWTSKAHTLDAEAGA